MLNLNLSRQSSKFIKTLPPKQAKQIALKIVELRNNPYPHDAIFLKGYPYRRTDMGEYRIIYDVEAETLQILIIGNRNDDEVYKQLKRSY